MRFLMLVCEDVQESTLPPTDADRADAPEVTQWWQETNDAGHYVMGDRLRPARDAVTVRVRSGETLVTQGPLSHANDVVLGFDILECDSIDAATRLASGHPMAHAGVIELRALWPFDQP